MRMRHPDVRRVKKLRLYTVEELATVLNRHKNTVRRWVKVGLQAIDDRRPALFRGSDVVTFLRTSRQSAKQPCGPGEIYCLRCRSPQTPDGGFADLFIKTPSIGSLIGICPACHGLIYRRVNPALIDKVRGTLEITVQKAEAHIANCSNTNLNDDSGGQRS
jgi:hypothetical protein